MWSFLVPHTLSAVRQLRKDQVNFYNTKQSSAVKDILFKRSFSI